MDKRATFTNLIVSISLAGTVLMTDAWAGNQVSSHATGNKALAIAPLPAIISAPHMVPKQKVISKAALRKKALQAYPRTHFEKGQYFKGKGDINSALIEFLRSTQENPKMVRAYYEQALIFRERGYLKLAQSSLEQALAVKHDYQEARILLATIQIQQGNFGGAMQELGRSLGLDVNTKKEQADEGQAASDKPPSVLQQVHSTMPSLDPQPGGKRIHEGKDESAALKEEQPKVSFSLRPYPTVERHESTPTPVSSPKDDEAAGTVKTSAQTGEEKRATANQEPEGLFGIRMPKSFHRFWRTKSGASAGQMRSERGSQRITKEEKETDEEAKDESASQEKKTTQTPAPKADERLAPANERTSDKETSPQAKAPLSHKRSGRGWFMRFFANNEVNQEDSDGIKPTQEEPDEQTAEKTTPHLEIRQPAKLAKEIEEAQTAERRDQERHAQTRSTEKLETAEVADTHKGEREVAKEITAIAEEQHSLPPLKFAPAAAKDIPEALAKKLAFQTPPLPSSQPSLLAAIPSSKTTEQAQTLPDDDWAKRLKYLNEHGTASLKDGEAFMFSEDTGEATLFLSDGQTIRRLIAPPRDAQEVARQRRPDLFVPEELIYNLSLLAKLMPKEPEAPPQAAAPEAEPQNNFSVENIMGKSQGFWGWLKKAFTLQ